MYSDRIWYVPISVDVITLIPHAYTLFTIVAAFGNTCSSLVDLLEQAFFPVVYSVHFQTKVKFAQFGRLLPVCWFYPVQAMQRITQAKSVDA
jgi:hypothetical protein